VGEDRSATSPRVTVAEAARILDTTAEEVISRIKRGTLESTKEGTTVYVRLSPDQTALKQEPNAAQTANQARYESDTLISEMRGRIEDLRAQLEAERQAHAEARRTIADLVERIPPVIEAPSEPRESPTEGAKETKVESIIEDGARCAGSPEGE
jgi:hypothetical protein